MLSAFCYFPKSNFLSTVFRIGTQNFAQRLFAMLIINIGMPRSGTLWRYKIIRDLVVAAGGKDGSVIRKSYLLHPFYIGPERPHRYALKPQIANFNYPIPSWGNLCSEHTCSANKLCKSKYGKRAHQSNLWFPRPTRLHPLNARLQPESKPPFFSLSIPKSQLT